MTSQALTYPYIDVLPDCPAHLRLYGVHWRKHLYTPYSLRPDKLTNAQLALIYYTEYYYYFRCLFNCTWS